MKTIGNSSKGNFEPKPKYDKRKTQEKPKKSFFTSKTEETPEVETKSEE